MTEISEKSKILIVDDISENLEVLSTILEDEEYEISFAMSGKQALEVISYEMPDLILLDISMPEMSGFEVCQALKTDKSTKHIPIIFLTANANTESIVKGFEIGGQDYITKPFNHSELIIRVKTHLEIKKAKEKLELKNKKINEQRIEIESQNEKLSTSNHELAAALDILSERNEEINLKNKNLTDSITYAQIIQESLMQSVKGFTEIFTDSFIINKPKDIVSGDFYFYWKVNEKVVVCAADCTGHGVPGALLTMLGITTLEQLINHHQLTKPSVILKKLDEEITRLFHAVDTVRDIDNGMDVSLTCIDTKNKKMLFSGAKRPLFILRNKELIIHKGQNISIGDKNYPNKDFIDIEINIKSNDYIYQFSDGYPDQFGGDKKGGKKYSIKRLKNLISSFHGKDFKTQKLLLESELNNWQGRFEQIDDILFMGYKL